MSELKPCPFINGKKYVPERTCRMEKSHIGSRYNVYKEGGRMSDPTSRRRQATDAAAALTERVWSLHCRGNTVTEIANRLAIEPGEARLTICEIWKADKGA